MTKCKKVELINEILLDLTKEAEQGGFNELSQTLEETLINLFDTMTHKQLDFIINEFKECFRLNENILKYN